MIELIKKQLNEKMPDEEKLNRCREVLQIAALKMLYDKGFTNQLAFVGGTELRVLYDLRRFSEDLDFSLVKPEGYNFPKLVSSLTHEFGLYGLTVEAKPKEEKTVHSVFLKFRGLLKELGLAPLKAQVLSVKLEVDSNPPPGGKLTRSLVNKTYVFYLTHFDLPSSFATKLCACFFRKYIKGRDFYDLIWYVGRKIKPDFLLLNNAIAQTQKQNFGINESNFKEFVLERLKKVDFSQAKKDVERFLEDKTELKLFDYSLIKDSIEQVY
ncbi:MAG: nucleotidyl transferase AbiEii/AbiGii toxin family protein [Candidatus Omnitrophota bacterium]